MYQEKISNYIKENKYNDELGFDKSRLDANPNYFSSYLNQV